MKKIAPFLIILTLFSCNSSSKKEITIFAAASTTNIIDSVYEKYISDHDVKININYASSGVLAKQIRNGANSDIFISASKKWVDFLKEEIILSDIFLNNSLVLISPSYSNIDNIKLSDKDFITEFNGRLSIGDPDYVPAGSYSAESLKYFGLYERLNNRLLKSNNVRAALSVVELGECDLGIVYKTDALISQKVKIVSTIDRESHRDIAYYCGILSNNSYATDFYNYLLTDPEVKKLISEFGFINVE